MTTPSVPRETVTPKSPVTLVAPCPGVYRITDAKSGKFYIGSSVHIGNRWRQHCYRLERGTHPNPILQAIWKVDPARLSVEIVAIAATVSRDALLQAEQSALDVAGVGSNPLCMNVLRVAGSHLGQKRGDETRRRLAIVATGKSPSVETRAKMRAAKLGRPLSHEHRALLSSVRTGGTVRRPKGMYRFTQRALSDDQVRALRLRRREGASWRVLASEFGINASAAKRVALRQTYAEVE